MKFSIEKNILEKNLNYVSKAIQSNTPIPALSGILFEITNEGLVLIGSNLEINIKAFIPKFEKEKELINIEEIGLVVLNNSFITEIVKKIDSEFINFEVIDSNIIKIYNQHSEFLLNIIDAEDYPKLNVDKSSSFISFSKKEFKNIIKSTIFAISKNETRPILTGINFHFISNFININATDSYRLSYKKLSIDKDFDFNLIIPGKSLYILNSILSDDKDLTMYIFNNRLIFEFDNVIFQTKLLDGTYPNTQKLIPETFSLEISTSIRDLKNAVERASILSRDRAKNVVKLKINENQAHILSSTPEFGKVDEELKITNLTGGEIDISFSARYLLDAINSFNSESVHLKFNSDMKPFICLSPDDESLIQLVLPVRTY